MSATNGDSRLQAVEADTKDLRTLMMLEFRALRAEMARNAAESKHIKEICQHTAKAVDILIAHAQLDEKSDE